MHARTGLPLTSPTALLATAGGLGKLRPAPGTWGSAGAALAGGLWLSSPLAHHHLAPLVLPLACLVIFVLGVWSAGNYGRLSGIDDPPEIVIDEVLGMWLTLTVLPSAVAVASPWTASILGLVFFRLFDVFKPFPVRSLERLPRGWGVIADDAAAGLLAGLLTTAILR